mgnify:FL=1
MKKKTYLLPHIYQKIGWWLAGASLAGWLLFFVSASLSSTITIGTVYNILMSVLTFLPSVALILISLSQEKQEDEYIQNIRARSVFMVVVFAFIVKMLFFSATQFFVRFCPLEIYGRLSCLQLFTSVLVLAFLYLVIFKGSIYIDYIKSKRNGE